MNPRTDPFYMLAESSPDAIFVGTQGCFRYLNPAAVRLFGATSPDQLVGQPVIERIHPRDRAVVAERIRQVNDDRGPVPLLEETYLRLDGTEVGVEVSAVPFRYQDQDGALVFVRDITRRREMDRALQGERRFLRQVIDASPNLVFVKDRAGRFLLANEATARAYGTTVEGLQGRTDADFNPNAEEVAAFLRDDREVMDSRRGKLIVEEPVSFADGSLHWYSTSKTPLLDDDGACNKVLGVATDISELKRAEGELRQSRRFVQSIIDNTTAVIFVKDLDGRYLLINRRYGELFHVANDTMLGRTDADLFPAGVVAALRAADQAVLAAGTALEFEEVVPQDDGPHTYIALKFPLVDAAGRAYAVCGIATDITERKRTEVESRRLNGELAQRTAELVKRNEELRREISERLSAERGLKLSAAVIGNATEGILVTDAENRIILVNQAFSDITGYSEEDVLGLSPGILHSGAHDPAFYRAMWQALAEQRHWQGEIMNRRKDGTIYPEWLSISVVLNEHGAPSNYIGVFSDISERKGAEVVIRALNESLEQRVRERTSELELTNKKLQSFSYSISHDLRAPLRAIHGFAAIVKESADDRLTEEERQCFDRIMINANRMGELIDDMLEFSRISSRAALAVAEVDTEALAHQVLAELRPSYPDTEIRVAPLPRIHADAILLRQAFENLVSNALKFSSKCAHPLVELGCQTNPVGEALFWVRDNGVGFDMEYASRLFEVFQRMHPEADYPGTGVGLAIVKSVVERHKGRVWVESAPGAGAAFYFTIPGAAAIS